jgi:hypothetical protein
MESEERGRGREKCWAKSQRYWSRRRSCRCNQRRLPWQSLPVLFILLETEPLLSVSLTDLSTTHTGGVEFWLIGSSACALSPFIGLFEFPRNALNGKILIGLELRPVYPRARLEYCARRSPAPGPPRAPG